MANDMTPGLAGARWRPALGKNCRLNPAWRRWHAQRCRHCAAPIHTYSKMVVRGGLQARGPTPTVRTRTIGPDHQMA